MNFLNSIPYEIGSTFEENNIDLELRGEFDISNLYRSHRYSEIYLFGKGFESICYLWFIKNRLTTIEYRFPMKYLELFKDSINHELPLSKQLIKDPFIPKIALESYVNKVAIGLVELSRDFFLFTLSERSKLT